MCDVVIAVLRKSNATLGRETQGLYLPPRLEDKLTLATEEGIKLVSALYSSLAFYKDRYKDEHGKIRRLFT